MATQTWARPLYRVGQFVGALAVIVIALLTAADVVMRYFFNAAIFGAAEVANALLAIVVGAGLIVVAAQRIHICVDLFEGPLRKRFPTLYSRWVFGTEVLGTAALAVLLAQHAWHTIEFGELTAVLEFPIGWIFALVALFVTMALAVLISGWRADGFHKEDEQ
jgi:TRAP-type C4-dicarboxylate transport system permease small subunit